MCSILYIVKLETVAEQTNSSSDHREIISSGLRNVIWEYYFAGSINPSYQQKLFKLSICWTGSRVLGQYLSFVSILHSAAGCFTGLAYISCYHVLIRRQEVSMWQSNNGVAMPGARECTPRLLDWRASNAVSSRLSFCGRQSATLKHPCR